MFLDLKFHDIPNTVEQACAAATRLGVWMLNVHACGGAAMLAAAREGVDRAAREATRPAPLLIGVAGAAEAQLDAAVELGDDALLVVNGGLLHLRLQRAGNPAQDPCRRQRLTLGAIACRIAAGDLGQPIGTVDPGTEDGAVGRQQRPAVGVEPARRSGNLRQRLVWVAPGKGIARGDRIVQP